MGQCKSLPLSCNKGSTQSREGAASGVGALWAGRLWAGRRQSCWLPGAPVLGALPCFQEKLSSFSAPDLVGDSGKKRVQEQELRCQMMGHWEEQSRSLQQWDRSHPEPTVSLTRAVWGPQGVCKGCLRYPVLADSSAPALCFQSTSHHFVPKGLILSNSLM